MKYLWLIVLAMMGLVLAGCQGETYVATPMPIPPVSVPEPIITPTIPESMPNVVTNVATYVTSTSVVLNGGISSIGGDNVTARRGFQWGLSSGIYTNSWAEDGNYPIGKFSHTAGSLSGDTTYYYRAFATSSVGTGYGSELSVSTLTTPTVKKWSSPNYWVAPSKINIGHLYLGAVAETWIEDSTLPNGYQYKKDEPLCITIYNNTFFDAPYAIELDNANGGQPIDYANWISVSIWNPVVPAQSAMNIPFRIQIPDKVIGRMPNQWEFRFAIIPSGQGNVQYAPNIRVIIMMR